MPDKAGSDFQRKLQIPHGNDFSDIPPTKTKMPKGGKKPPMQMTDQSDNQVIAKAGMLDIPAKKDPLAAQAGNLGKVPKVDFDIDYDKI